MSLIEEFSPNVKLTLASMYEVLNETLSEESLDIYSKFHSNGIIELCVNTGTTNNKNFNIKMRGSFSAYFNWFSKHNAIEDVSITGINSNLNLGQGSTRFSTMSPYLAEIFTYLITKSGVIPSFNAKLGNFYKVSNYFRFMQYSSGGQHYPHYDSDYKFIDPNFYTKYSLVAYHDTCDTGELFFCNDPRNINKYSNKDTSDWDRQATEEEIYLKIKSDNFKIVLFPHTLCHGVLPFTEDKRRIIRGDLIFRS